ncbi:aminopeptidase N [Luteipulveratus flavus]|uniref:Aminopeptidase N n=1 Tax=Luteipulveratus flavus TaxID=3031728 RepID=A0ABT6C3U9_9MICO|nr:aminopeptidase N [Luteipulveratus sp. YIM 133296]MDF8263641.1 aminopeptidase N [Luteipulveratus sp. YIM 133296]
MTENTNLTHAECQARATTVAVRTYRVELDLAGAPDPSVPTFRSRSTITFTAENDATWVDLIAERVVSATLNDAPLDVSAYDGARLPVTGLAAENELVVEADCVYSRSGEGLHRFTDPVDDQTYLYTHFEPTDARRLFANFEQPDLKARFTFVVTAPADWEILSGQPEVSRTTSGSTATVTFAETPPLSTYITAIAAGPYFRAEDTWRTTRADGSTQEIALGAFCRRSMAEHFHAEEIFTVTQQGLSFFDREFGYPYPWGKYDQIYVPEYNLGAMENPGLVTFTETYLHRGTATLDQQERRSNTTMHEMAHMWFGDLVTPRWWDGLWLKESFADLMGYDVNVAATEYKNAWTTFACGRKAWAYRQDQLPTTHPVVATIDDLEAARQNFDGITYAKGASALKQLMAYVGREAFFAGSREYFATHAYGSTELDDLLVCLERASGRDLKEWSQVWLETAGISELTPEVEHDGEGRITRLTIVQSATDPLTGEDVARPHRLVVGLYELVGDELRPARSIELDVTDGRTEVPDAVGVPGALVVVNDEDLTYAKVRLDEVSLAVAREHLSSLESNLTRALVWSSLWNATRDALLPASAFLDIVHAQAGTERDAALLAIVLEQARGAIVRYLPEGERAAAGARLVDTTRAGLRAAAPGSDAQQTWAKYLAHATGLSGSGLDDVRGLLDGSAVPEGLTVDADLRWECWQGLAAQDAATLAELDAALAADDTMTGRTAYLLARASRPAAEAKDEAWERATTDGQVTNDQLRSLVHGFNHPSGSPDPSYADRYFEALTEWWRTHTMTMAGILVAGLYPGGALAAGQEPERHPVVLQAQEWLDGHADAPKALRRIVVESLDDHLRALRAQRKAPVQQPAA